MVDERRDPRHNFRVPYFTYEITKGTMEGVAFGYFHVAKVWLVVCEVDSYCQRAGGGLTGAYGRKVGWPGRVGVLACGTITEVKHPILHLWLSFLGGRVRLLTL
jgi:hypothetical protein